MKISPLNSISFTSTPLYNVKLRKTLSDGTQEKLDARFSKLESDNERDVARVADLCRKWFRAYFGIAAGRNFLISDEYDEMKKFDYYVIEGISKNGDNEIYSIAEFNRDSRTIEYIESNPNNKEKNIKGSGELMLWGIAKKNKSNDNDKTFSLTSSNGAMGFYSKAGLKNFNHSFVLFPEDTDNFLREIERKYNLET